MAFGLIWLMIFIKDKTVFIAMFSAASYYFSSNAEKEGSAQVLLGMRFAYFKHAGSLALGSLLHTIFTVIRIIVEAAKDGQKDSDNAAAKCAAACLLCLARCIEDLIEHISKLSYAFMAVSGESYCTSAWNGFILNLKHCVKFYFASTLASAFVFIGQLLITGFSCGLFWVVANYLTYDVYAVNSLAPSMIFVGIFSLIISGIFLGLFDESVTATIIAMGIDMDLNGTPKFGPPTFHQKLRDIYGEDDKIEDSEQQLNYNQIQIGAIHNHNPNSMQ
mmetsp:Transcript_8407/g.14058  ORF Transcript_8407/g.14058 Transcript_8407/m.14058 type:complete len:276 (-) Transcript_8407:47-874(-)